MSVAEIYHLLARFAQTAGLVYFIAIFAGVVFYALRPRNRATFEAAAHIPLQED